jgi:hypothetical protein
VRIHETGRASDLGALAFAQGTDLHFAPGRYQEHTQSGQALIGHELAHVVQQSAGRVSAPAQAKGARVVADPVLEAEADRAGDAAARGEPVRLSGSAAAGVALPKLASQAIQRKASPEQAKAAEDAHAEAQRRVYGWVRKDTEWDHIRRGDPPPNQLTPEQRAQDPHVIFNNSVEWITSGALTLTVLSAAPDPPDGSLGFDPKIAHPSIGGKSDSTVALEPGVPAWTQGGKAIYVVASQTLTQERFRELIRHEVQHAASSGGVAVADQRDQAAFAAEPGATQTSTMMNSIIWQKYQSEFRSYWLESIARPGAQVAVSESGQPVTTGGSGNTDRYGSESGPGGELRVTGAKGQPDIVIQLQNEKQTKIANLIIHNYMGMEETFRVSAKFRADVQAMDRAEGVDLVNSLRIEHLRRAIHAPATRVSLWQKTVPREHDVATAVKALDATDIAFLKRRAAQPFWEDAQATLDPALFKWMSEYIQQDKRDAPPPATETRTGSADDVAPGGAASPDGAAASA